MIADERQAYTMTDRATWAALMQRLKLSDLYEGDPELLNFYNVVPVSKDRFPAVNAMGGRAFADWVVSPEAQQIIDAFGRQKYGRGLFHGASGKTEAEFGVNR
jgi:tungstate transport system substrate-binding protein